MSFKFRDRTEAGQLLANRLLNYADRSDVLVLALPRGGVPVGYEIAHALKVPLEVCLVRKLGAPRQPELAMGAIAPGGVMVLNNEVLKSLQISRQTLLQVATVEKQELERRQQTYLGDRPALQIRDRVVILVDDGIATGATLRAAISLLQRQQPQALMIATPIAPAEVCESLQRLGHEVVCLLCPEQLNSIGLWYQDFSQTSDQEVCYLLQQAAQEQMKCPLG